MKVAAPAGGVTAGDVVLIGSIFGVAMGTAAAGADVIIARGGVYSLPSSFANAVAAGDDLRWSGTALTDDARYPVVAVALDAALSSATSIRAMLTSGVGKTDLLIPVTIGSPSSVSAETAVATATIPAGILRVGDAVEAVGGATATATTTTEESQVRLRIGGVAGVAMAISGSTDVANADIAGVQGLCLVETLGAAAASKVHTQGLGFWSTAGTVVPNAAHASTALDTTAAIVVAMTVEQDSTGNTVRPDYMSVRVRRAA